MKMRVELKQKMEQKLSVQMIQSMEILQLPMLELTTLIKQELEANPTLEVTEQQVEPSGEKPSESSPIEQTVGEAPATVERLDEKRDGLGRERFTRGGRGGSDQKLEALQNVPDKSLTLQDYLYQQFVLMEIPDEIKAIGKNIIYNIDDNGYFKTPVEEIASSCNISLEKANEALKLIQKLDPPGVGARDLKECLLLQLREDDPNLELKKLFINEYLEEINKNKLPAIAKTADLDIEKVKLIVNEIALLAPHPGVNFTRETIPYIVPDITVENIDGRYEIRLSNEYIPSLSINRYYSAMLGQADLKPETRDFIKKKVEAARWLISAIQLRQHTLNRIAGEIVRIQKLFLDEGIMFLRPLKMQEIATSLGVHVSTVSRAIAGKYIQTPQGIFSMKFFFSRPAETTSDQPQSPKSTVRRIQELIEQEDKQHPLSDTDIVEKLHKEGINIARRTVTKYRKILKIPASTQRKLY